jgi:hypothetical protein
MGFISKILGIPDLEPLQRDIEKARRRAEEAVEDLRGRVSDETYRREEAERQKWQDKS